MDEFERILQIGKVTAIDIPKKKARVFFPDSNMTSDWLSVLQHPHSITVEGTLCDGVYHSHKAVPSIWMPAINDSVVVCYLPIFNSDGFILGVV